MKKLKSDIIRESLEELLDELKKELDINVEVIDMSNDKDVDKLKSKIDKKDKKSKISDDDGDFLSRLVDWRLIVHDVMKENDNDVEKAYAHMLDTIKKAYKCANIMADIKDIAHHKHAGIVECLIVESARAFITLDAYKYSENVEKVLPMLFDMIDYAKKELNK